MGFASNQGDIVLVTGASGFIGGAVARRLVREGYRVRTFVRPVSQITNIPAGCEIYWGDIVDADSLTPAMTGVRFVFHLAADYRLWVPDTERLMRVNVSGTENVMRAALRAGVERIVHTSSVATLEPNSVGGCSELRRLEPEQAVGSYKRSKVLSERLVETMIEKERLPAVIVCPSAPLGPGDLRPTPTGRIVSEALLGRMPAYVDTGLNIVHVDDVASGQLAALNHGAVGERYILGGENLTLCALLNEICSLSGRPGPKIRLPSWPLMPIAFANEMLARAIGYEPFLNRDALRMSRTRMYFDDSKARQELGYAPRSAREAIKAAVQWFGRPVNVAPSRLDRVRADDQV